MPDPTVGVAIVTCNSARYIRRCLEAVLEQQEISLSVVVVDNASTDATRQILKDFRGRVKVIYQSANTGFAEGQNRAIQALNTRWILTLNPDVLLLPGFIRRLVDAGEMDSGAGAVCGKLLSIAPGFEPLSEPRIDSAGMFFTPAMRHFDRGWHEPDAGRFDRMEYVFGASAAAALFRRKMIDDIAVEGSFFDPDFFFYREDADVAWRAQLMGWRCIYTPDAQAYHVRTVTPRHRRSLPAPVNMHSVKNRFLMRIKNATGGLYRRFWLPMTIRDVLVVGGVLLWEHSSVEAFWHLAKCTRRAFRQRQLIMNRRRVSDDAMAHWFSFEPASEPLGELPPPRLRRAAGRGLAPVRS